MKHKMVEHDRINILEGNDVNKTSASKECDICQYYYFKDIAMHQKNVIFVNIIILKILLLSMNRIFVMVVMI